MSTAILTDVTRCIGCRRCVQGCQAANETGEAVPHRWQRGFSDLSATRWTTILDAPGGRFARFHCRHCVDPACAAACPVGALSRRADGAVAYDSSICMGCRYCMMACPFQIPRYEWGSAAPRVRKCVLCHERIASGAASQPACTESCPTAATIFGAREALLAEAHRRIESSPGYLDHVWGEHEVGGTAVLYVSDVDLAEAGWPEGLGPAPRPELARLAVGAAPAVFGGVLAFMFGVHWTYERRLKVEAARRQAEQARDGGQDEVSR